jgi:methionyl-tRNA synthetase
LGYGAGGEDYPQWWVHSGQQVHLVGKGVLRFHAVYWPAMLLSAGEPVPTDILVHDYLTADGRKLSKSTGNVVDPLSLVDRFGTDAVRWWLLREVPRAGDTDFTVDRLVARANQDLANGVGNLVNRVVTMVHRYRDGLVPDGRAVPGWAEVDATVDAALAVGDFRAASAALRTLLGACTALARQLAPFLPGAAARIAAQCEPGAGRLPDPRPLFPRVG